jgi:hypothetical protein
MAIVSVAIVMSFHLKSKPSDTGKCACVFCCPSAFLFSFGHQASLISLYFLDIANHIWFTIGVFTSFAFFGNLPSPAHAPFPLPQSSIFTRDLTLSSEKRIALPFGIVFWVLSMACLISGLANYIKTVTRYSRRAALVQAGWKTQVLFTVVATAIVAACVLFLATNARSSR